jgi:foldase protein PrsA
MSKAHFIIAGLLTVSLAACSGGGSIVTVNGQAIDRSSFDNKLEGSPAARSVLQQMVQAQLLDQYASKNHITVTDADITAKEDQIKANFPAGSWDQMLAARGMTEADVHDLLRNQIIIDKAVGGNIKISDADIKAYFDKNHAQFDTPESATAKHILVNTLPEALKVEAALKKGGDFAALAKQYSIDPGSKNKGGELGTFRHGQMAAPFEKAAFSQPIGVVGPPVKSQYGYHIIVVESRTPATKATLASAHDKIAELLREQQEQPLAQPFVTNLFRSANIQVQDKRFASLFPSPPPSAAPAAAPAASAAASAAPSATK